MVEKSRPQPLAAMYALIRQDLELVEKRLRSLVDDSHPTLTELLRSTMTVAGKRIRPALTLLAGQSFHSDRAPLITMASAVELFHTATLIHDDIVDKALVRRGQPTVSNLHGQEVALLLGDYLFAQAAEMVCQTGNMEVMQLFAQTLSTISGGELQHNMTSPGNRQTQQHYFQWISRKTASLFSLATTSGAILSQAPPQAVQALRDYGHNLGLSFQVVDDILDLIGEEKELGKGVGWDMRHGTLTLPAILLAERYPEGGTLLKALKDNHDAEASQRARQLIAEASIIRDCYGTASALVDRAREALSYLAPSPTRQALYDLTEYSLNRKS